MTGVNFDEESAIFLLILLFLLKSVDDRESVGRSFAYRVGPGDRVSF